MPLILASGSAIRHAMLLAAGVSHSVERPEFDESAVKRDHRGDDGALASDLAGGKALEVSRRLSGKWAIGADSLVSVKGRRFSKPADRAEAAEHLAAFSGQAMALTSAVALARDGRIDWICADRAILHVRPLSTGFIHNYLEAEWPAVAGCVGVFRMEGLGAQLFEAVEGSHFTVLGLPLLPLLSALRERGLLAS